MDTEQLALWLQETKDRSLRNEGRIKKLESEHDVLQKLATSVAVMAEKINTMNGSISTLTDEVEELKEKPAKRWENVVGQIIGIFIAALAGFMLAKFGL